MLQALASGLLLGGLLALTALGLSLVVGVIRVVNLLHGVQVVLGAYAALLLIELAHVNPWVAALVAAAVLAALSYPIERLLLQPVRRHGEEIALLTTFALAIIAQNLLVLLLTGNTRAIDSGLGDRRLLLGGIALPEVELIGFAISLAACLAVHALIAHTRFGRAVRASAEDPMAASILGIAVQRLHASTYALAGALAGLGGALFGMVYSFTPNSSVDYLLSSFAVVVLGGLGSVTGTLVAGLALGVIESVAALRFGDGYRLFAALLAFLIFLIVRPQGLFARRA